MRYSCCNFMRSGNLSPCYFTFIPFGKLVLNCVRSSGTHSLHKMGPHFLLLFVAVVSTYLAMHGCSMDSNRTKSNENCWSYKFQLVSRMCLLY